MLDKVKRFKDRVDEFLSTRDNVKYSLLAFSSISLFTIGMYLGLADVKKAGYREAQRQMQQQIQEIVQAQNMECQQMLQQIQEMVHTKNNKKSILTILKIQDATKEVDNTVLKRH